MSNVNLSPGEPAPWFEARTPVNPRFRIDSVAGRYVVLCFFGSAQEPGCRPVLDGIFRERAVFDDENVSFFGISIDPEDENYGKARDSGRGIHFFWDFERNISQLYGAVQKERENPSCATEYRRFSVILDERLRVLEVLPFGDQPEQHVRHLLKIIASLPRLNLAEPTSVPAPVLVVPRVFEPELCRVLIRYYETLGGRESGFMREIEGKTVEVHDPSFKRRRDQEIMDGHLRKACMTRIHDRLVPEIAKAFQFHATRIERYIVSCYEAESGGYFKAHRDNTTKGTAHRRFAVSLVLNEGDFEGGKLRFPEFGRQLYGPPAGGALVFSCSLLHEATPVTRGKRYVFLPFLYDDEAAKIRQENSRFIVSKETRPSSSVTG